MQTEGLLTVLFLGPYVLMSMWGLLVMASYWTWGSPKGVSDPVFTVLGLVVPLAAQALAIMLPPAGYATAAALGLLYFLMSGTAEDDVAARAAQLHQRLDEADAALALDPGNAAALMLRAETLEDLGLREQALASYEEAHGISDRLLPKTTLEQHRERLSKPAPEPVTRGAKLPELELLFLVAALLYAPYDLARAVSLGALMLFALWVRRR